MRVFGIVGWKNSGKTGLVERLVEEMVRRNITVSTIKHAHHMVDVDRPGTDSYRHRIAGASEVILASAGRVAIMQELRSVPEPTLDMLLERLSPVDLVLVEGYKRERHPKIEAHRAETGQPLIGTSDQTVRAYASDEPLEEENRPVFDLDDTAAIASFILGEVGL